MQERNKTVAASEALAEESTGRGHPPDRTDGGRPADTSLPDPDEKTT
jgi:hypothetical protein